jgi:hypothetical protein
MLEEPPLCSVLREMRVFSRGALGLRLTRWRGVKLLVGRWSILSIPEEESPHVESRSPLLFKA